MNNIFLVSDGIFKKYYWLSEEVPESARIVFICHPITGSCPVIVIFTYRCRFFKCYMETPSLSFLPMKSNEM